MMPAKALVMVAAAMAVVAGGQSQPPPPRFSVAVDLVSVDAVVTDRQGNVVRDLTAADFEVLQDGRRQRVSFAQFVPVKAPAASVARPRPTGPPPSASVAATPPHAAPLTPDQVQRTIVLVVDDLGLSFTGMTSLRHALRDFVDTSLESTDLVAIVRTGESRGLQQALTNDRAALQSAVDELHYNIRSRKGVLPTGDVMQVGDSRPEVGGVEGLLRSSSGAGSLTALNLVVQAARDLPGRKTVIFASEGFPMVNGTDGVAMPDPDPRVRARVDRVVDQATRSGVVIYTVDCQALQATGLRASDDIHAIPPEDPDAVGRVVRELAADRSRTVRDAQESLVYLAEQTGGFAVFNTNDLARGLHRISVDVRDYYLIGYEPDRETFALQGKTPRTHKIVVNVKRSGVRVRTRKEFLGVADPARPTTPQTPAQELVRAAFSPFSTAAIGLHAMHVFGYSSTHGMFVRTVLHLDAHALTFSVDARGRRTASADLVGLVFNSDGALVDTISTGFDVALANDATEEVTRRGIVQGARVAIAKPGGYQLRYAVRDRRSGAIGSVGGFVDVPDVIGGTFALSGLILRGDERSPVSATIDEGISLPPADVLRVYAPGTRLTCSFEIYNAHAPVRLLVSLWRDAERLSTNPLDTLTPEAGRPGPLFAEESLTLPQSLPPGRYVLQVSADTAVRGKTSQVRRAVQRADFEVK